MPVFKADLHIHSLTSPCGSLEMSPKNIVETALKRKLDIIAIADHNCTKQVPLIQKIAKESSLVVIGGAEVNTSEEVHCLALFESQEQLLDFQFFIDQHMLPIPNNPDYFGHQVVVDEKEMIVEEIPYLLTNALDASLQEVEQKVHHLNGLVIPAHIDRPFNGLFSQLGFIPDGFQADAYEISRNASLHDWVNSGKLPKNSVVIGNSDAHHPKQIGESCTFYELERPTFKELKKALLNQEGRKVLQIEKNKN